jgi:tripartite-type tricarboxylate transporter receptor subunit TctC
VNIQKSFVIFLVALFGCCSQAQAQTQETRVALVIGNSNYKNSPLKNPVNDARDMAIKLRGLGFTVVERNNLVVKQIGSTLREFRSKLTPGSVALVYYAGHGLQIKGDNYFPTVDADITGEEDVPNQSLAMKQIMDVLGDAKTRLNLVFLDACRNNPYSRSFRSGSDGLSKVNAPTGTLISFATRPGSVAADGVGRNGLYTGALLEAMDNRGQPIEQVLKRVVTSVKAGSRNQQEPWMEGSIEGEFCFGNCTTVVAQVGVSDDRALWESVKDSRDINDLNAYLRKFPQGLFSEVAMNRIKSMSHGGTQVAMPSVPAGISSSPPSPVGQSANQSPRPSDSSNLVDCFNCPDKNTFPTKEISLMVPFAPGGTTDLIAKTIASPMAKILGQNVSISYKPGGGGSNGQLEVMKSPSNGYFLGFGTTSTFVHAPAINAAPLYDPVEDFTPIANIAATPGILLVHPTFSARDFRSFVTELKKNPGKYSYASSGTGGFQHFQMEMLKSLTGTFVTHVPYKGTGPALYDALTGQIPIIYENFPSSLPHIQSGKLIPIAVATPERLAQLPNVPTFKEVGLEPLNRMFFYGVYGPKGMSKEVVEKLNSSLRQVFTDSNVRKKINEMGSIVVMNSSDQFKAQIKSEYEVSKKLVQFQNMR